MEAKVKFIGVRSSIRALPGRRGAWRLASAAGSIAGARCLTSAPFLTCFPPRALFLSLSLLPLAPAYQGNKRAVETDCCISFGPKLRMNRIAGVLCLMAVGAMALPSQQPDWMGCGGQGLSLCLQMRALKFVDNLNQQGKVELTDGVVLVGEPAKAGRALNNLEDSLPSDADERENQVQQLLVERVARFLSTHTLQVKLPEESIDEMKRSVEEGRKKKKKFLLPLLLALKLKAIALVPLIIGALFILAFKALVVGKIALVLSALIGLQKLLGGHKTVEVVSSHGYESDHHYGRSADNLAYSAHAPQ